MRPPQFRGGSKETNSRVNRLSKTGKSPEEIIREAHDRWIEFIEFIDARAHTRWVFRGSGSRSYRFVPSIGRKSDTYTPLKEERLFRAFQRSADIMLATRPVSDWDWLAVAQHHGLPTRLLDWSTNPLVACYFAVSSHSKEEEDAVVHAYSIPDEDVIDPKKHDDPFSIDRVMFLLPSKSVSRIVNQRGLFSVHNKPNEPWDPPKMDEFVIPASMRARFRRGLFKMGIDHSHIYPDLGGLCETLKWRYEAGIGIGDPMIG
ncbi:FRG domain-containing protein [uncultured Roseibium sp.]|uniref:FRG domain-containing protein n=1 Tax=uncultured Roseibium sp. TaxID=1936171 RepID=UPI00260FA354|nr:FRG domain-containing protein [uncultured Roseibium sp.]